MWLFVAETHLNVNTKCMITGFKGKKRDDFAYF